MLTDKEILSNKSTIWKNAISCYYLKYSETASFYVGPVRLRDLIDSASFANWFRKLLQIMPRAFKPIEHIAAQLCHLAAGVHKDKPFGYDQFFKDSFRKKTAKFFKPSAHRIERLGVFVIHPRSPVAAVIEVRERNKQGIGGVVKFVLRSGAINSP